MSKEVSTDLQAIGSPVREDFEDFAQETGRKLKLEIEPGTFLVANAGSLVCTVQVQLQLILILTRDTEAGHLFLLRLPMTRSCVEEDGHFEEINIFPFSAVFT